MLAIIIRVIIIYIIILFVFRFMGKRQLGQMQPFELVLTLIIADLATIPMAEISIPVLHGIVPVITLVVLHFFLTVICKSNNVIDKAINGTPAIVIDGNGINYKVLKKLDITIEDIFECIRGCNYSSLEQIGYAIVETTGKMSIIPKPEYAGVTIQDLKIKPDELVIPYTIISDGSLYKDNLKLANIDEDLVKKIIEKQNTTSQKDVLVLTINKQGFVYYQEKNKPSTTFNINLKGEPKI